MSLTSLLFPAARISGRAEEQETIRGVSMGGAEVFTNSRGRHLHLLGPQRNRGRGPQHSCAGRRLVETPALSQVGPPEATDAQEAPHLACQPQHPSVQPAPSPRAPPPPPCPTGPGALLSRMASGGLRTARCHPGRHR